MTPTRKVAAGGVGGAIAIVVISIIEGCGVKVDGDLASAITTLATFLLAYFVPDADVATAIGQPESAALPDPSQPAQPEKAS